MSCNCGGNCKKGGVCTCGGKSAGAEHKCTCGGNCKKQSTNAPKKAFIKLSRLG